MSDENVIYLGYDNPITIQIKQTTTDDDGVKTETNLDFTDVTRMRCLFEGPTKTVIADSDDQSDLFDWTIGDGKIKLRFNDLDLSAGHYKATLIAHDSSHTDGQVLIHADIGNLRFRAI